MDVNYPDQIVSLFASGMVITAVMEARRTGKGCFLDFSQREVASFTIGEEILAAAADPAAGSARRATKRKAWRSRTPIAAATDAGSPSPWPRPTPTLGRLRGADRDDAVARLLAQGIAAAPCNDGNDLLRDTALAGVDADPRRQGRPGEGPALPARRPGSVIERAAPDLGQHTAEVLRALLGYNDAELAALERRA